MIRVEKEEDYRAVENLTRQAFWNLYNQGADQHFLLHNLRKSKDFIPELSLVVEEDNVIIAHIAYSDSAVKYQDGSTLKTITFGPVSVLPSCQCKGVGSKLIRYSIEKAASLGFKCILIQGYPTYYRRFGFRCTKEVNVCFEGGIFPLASMYLQLQKEYLTGKLGQLEISQGFNIKEEELQQFDKQFPFKEKYPTLSQKSFKIVSNLQWNDELPSNTKDAYNRQRIPQPI